MFLPRITHVAAWTIPAGGLWMITEQVAASQNYTSIAIPHEIATAATRYQLFRELEAEHLAVMARQNLLVDWTPEVRATVLAAREYVKDAREARVRFREHVRAFVLGYRSVREPLPQVLRHTRSMLQGLERIGAIRDDQGWLEAEVLEWAIEEFENVS
jgi:hypothetical protein